MSSQGSLSYGPPQPRRLQEIPNSGHYLCSHLTLSRWLVCEKPLDNVLKTQQDIEEGSE